MPLPHGNQEPSVVRYNVGRPAGEFLVSGSVYCDTFSIQCFEAVGWATVTCKKLRDGLLVVTV